MFNNYLFDKHLLKACLAGVFAIGLTACSSSDNGSGTDTGMTEPTPQETCEGAGGRWNADMSCTSAGELVIEMALANINAADTAKAAQAAYDAVKDDVTATDGETLQAAVNARIEALDTMARQATQMQALMDAADMIDTSDLSTQDLVDAARTAIAGLRQAIADAVDVDDTSMYQTTLDNAVDAVDTAQGGIDTATRRMNQMDALSSASTTLQAALTALSGATPTQALLDAANNALNALNTAITDGADLTDTEKAPYQREANNAAAPISMAQNAFDDAEDEAEKTAAAAMAVTASRLYSGIGTAPLTGHSVTVAADTGVWSVDPNDVAPANLALQALEADEDTMVADNHGWQGTRHTASGDDVTGTYEAIVYSHIGEPTVTEGLKFGSSTADDDYQYTLDARSNTELTIDDTNAGTGWAARVASTNFDQDAGSKMFKPLDGDERAMVGGSYHGVPGTYYCLAADRAVGCSATVLDMGFNLTGGTWTFKASSNDARIMDTSEPDILYASYGWWLHKSEDGETYTASAFHLYRGTDAGTVGIADLRGTAKYTGGAAGKYSLRGSTGGTNDAGHFTADVELNATFGEAHSIEGTIDNFVGADGETRDWSIALGNSVIADTGGIAGDPDDDTDTGAQMTTWTIDDTAGDASGQWSGDLREQGDDLVPAIATGTFHSSYGQNGNDGRMVGAFGANKE